VDDDGPAVGLLVDDPALVIHEGEAGVGQIALQGFAAGCTAGILHGDCWLNETE
jgi:hypothetical protein